MRGFAISERQRRVLGELDDILGEAGDESLARCGRIAEALVTLEEEAVLVFASSPRTVEELRVHLQAAGENVAVYTAGLPGDDRRLAALAFLEGAERRYLICDRAGEEGVNLQVADCIVHIDLPLSTTRIEQRIGRVDRHGSPRPVSNYVLAPGPAGGIGDWWMRALIDAFEVFDKTTAPIQYAIETVERGLLFTLALGGPIEASTAADTIRERVGDEQTRIDRLDSLDALARQETDDLAFVALLHADEEVNSDAFSRAFGDALDAVADDLGAVVAARETGSTAIRLSRVPPAMRIYSGVSDRQIVTSANRRLAVADGSVSLLRPGAPLVEAVRLHLDWDDRGQTAAVWARDDTLDEAVFGVRCDVIIRADPEPAFTAWKRSELVRPRTAGATRSDADAPLAIAALQRRLDAYLAPQPMTYWADQAGEVIGDLGLISRLNTALAEAAPQIWDDAKWRAVARHCGVLSIDDILAPMGSIVERALLSGASIVEPSRRAVERARADWQDAERALQLRADLDLDSSAAARDLLDERDVSRSLLEALASPSVRWSGAALVFLAAPEQGAS